MMYVWRMKDWCIDVKENNFFRTEYDLVILDELTIALFLGLLESDEVLNLLRSKRPETEVVVTGRYASQELIDIADLVTDMREVKHYYTQGVLSRDGIDR